MSSSLLDRTAKAACGKCDQLVRIPELLPGQQATCPHCKGLLLRHPRDSHKNGVAFCLAALVLLACALRYPFLGFSAGGEERFMSLLQSGTALLAANENLLGAIVIGFILIAPIVFAVLLATLLLGIRRRARRRRMTALARVLHEVEHWNMVEVFVIGVLVSLTKIASLATVHFGISFWALLGFCFCILAAGRCVDRDHLWRQLERLE